VKFFKNIPINKCFNYDDFRKKEIYYDRIKETVDNQQKQIDELNEQEKEYQKMLKDFEKKEKIKKMREKGETNEILEPEDYENVEIEKLLDEEIRFEELVFPKDALIGQGAFGEVKKAYWRKTLVSVKFLKPAFENNEKQVIPFIEEFNLLKQLRHPNILLYIGGNISGNQHFLVTEYCENGNLFEFLHGRDAADLVDMKRIKLALQIAQGINYLHSFKPPILHRDLKSLNILLDKNYVAKIADFGWARLRNEHMTKQRGTFQWMAPEVISKENYTEKADVYSFGIILWEFWSKDPPYKGIKAKDVAKKILTNKDFRPVIPDEVPEEIAELMECCWDNDPQKRPTFIEIINFLDDYLKNIQN
jgi:mitogen-activated protein kinase kinase kinase 9